MILRSAFALGVLATGLTAFTGDSQAQNYPPQSYPPYGQQQAYPPYRPLPGANVPDDDDDDIPANQRASRGNYPPPPGYRGPYAYEPRPDGQLPPPNASYGPPPGPAYGGRPPAVVYGDRNDGYSPQRQYGNGPNGPTGNGQPESYGAAPQPPYGPNQAVAPQAYPPPPGYQQGYQQDPAQGPVQLGPQGYPARPPGDVTGRETTGTVRPNTVATLPPDEQPEDGKADLPPQFKRQIVNFPSSEPAGTIVIDTSNTYLFLVLGNGQAMRYGIGVGREGFTWAGAERVSRMSEWPDWHPPSEMIERQPYLPRFMAGGEGNPLGARALYLGKTLYRIHGTNQPSTIGKYVSSGCIRLTNDDIADLYTRVQVGTRVVVLPGAAPATAANIPQQQQQQQQR